VRSAKGLSLIEILVALVLVAVVFMVLLSNLTGSFRGDRTANVKTQGAHFVENYLELYRLRWQDPDEYALANPPRRADLRRIARHLPKDATYEAEVKGLDLEGNDWDYAQGIPPLQQVTVRVKDKDGRTLAEGSLVIPNPDLGTALR